VPFRRAACACRSALRNPWKAHLERFRTLADRYQPALVFEHVAWATRKTVYFNDLLPLP
jgi:uncharacterized protein (UPF0276 family)